MQGRSWGCGSKKLQKTGLRRSASEIIKFRCHIQVEAVG